VAVRQAAPRAGKPQFCALAHHNFAPCVRVFLQALWWKRCRCGGAMRRISAWGSQVQNIGVRKMHRHHVISDIGDFVALTIGWALIFVGIYALS
jgi:hypothetical protein